MQHTKRRVGRVGDTLPADRKFKFLSVGTITGKGEDFLLCVFVDQDGEHYIEILDSAVEIYVSAGHWYYKDQSHWLRPTDTPEWDNHSH